MPSTVDRPHAANVVAHATEYPSDRQQRERDADKRHGNESAAQRPEDEPGSETANPAVLIDAHHDENHLLDGVAAYTAAAQQALGSPVKRIAERYTLAPRVERRPPALVRHAYEDHHGEMEEHEVNVAT